MAKQAAVIEIGSSKVTCTVASRSGDALTVHGFGTCMYTGGYSFDPIREVITYPNESALATAMDRAVRLAQNEAKVTINSAYVALNAPFLKVRVMRGSCSVPSKGRTVVESDGSKLMRISKENVNVPGYVPIHRVPISYYVDGEESLTLPIGKRVNKILEARVSHIFLDVKMAAKCDTMLNDLGIKRESFVAAPFAEALYLADGSNAEGYSVMVDVGYTHTDVALIKNNVIIDLAVIPLGGYNFRNDISCVENISQSAAESIKKRYRFGVNYEGTTEMIKDADGVAEYIDKNECSEIICDRMGVLCNCINDYMEYWDIVGKKVPVFLTGGGVMMEDADSYMQDKLKTDVLPQLPDVSRHALNTMNNASAFAVSLYVLDPWFDHESDIEDESEQTGFFARLFKSKKRR